MKNDRKKQVSKLISVQKKIGIHFVGFSYLHLSYFAELGIFTTVGNKIIELFFFKL